MNSRDKRTSSGQPRADSDKAHIELGKQLLELSDLGTRLGRQLAIQADRIALMIIKSDTTQMGIEHLDLIQGDIQATLREHTTLLGKIFDRLPQQQTQM